MLVGVSTSLPVTRSGTSSCPLKKGTGSVVPYGSSESIFAATSDPPRAVVNGNDSA